jgi:nucleoside-diphosphate-sugar epimerase
MEKALSSVDYVVHAAAALPIHHDKKYILDVNVNGTKSVLNASLKNKVKKMVFISTTAMYGVPRSLPEKETDPIYPIGHYGESKAEAEKLCLSFAKKGLKVNILRPKSFLGPERLGVFTIWFEAIFTNRPVFILGDGNNLYQLLEVVDLCTAVESALTVRASGEIFNIGAEKFGTWRENLSNLIKKSNSKSKIISLPVLPTQVALSILEFFNLSPLVAWHYKTFPVDSYVSIDKAKKILHYKATKSNDDILTESYDWYKTHRKEFLGKEGTTHRTVWNFKLVDIAQKFFR